VFIKDIMLFNQVLKLGAIDKAKEAGVEQLLIEF
jgi:hypothetical protein